MKYLGKLKGVKNMFKTFKVNIVMTVKHKLYICFESQSFVASPNVITFLTDETFKDHQQN